MPQSNINVVSNIYIRNPDSIIDSRDDLNKDPEFVKQVSGEVALRFIKNQYSGIASKINLTPVQEEELSQSARCSLAKNRPGEIPFGKVMKNGELSYESRCEVTDCPHYATCSKKQYTRDITIGFDEEETFDNTSVLFWDSLFDNSSVEVEERKELNSVPENEIVDIKDLSTDKREFQQISSEEAVAEIIKADINSHILVNAGPGSGKTYTAIQRLLFILNQIPPEECDRILVLCYTRAAVGEINKRIEEGIINRTLPGEAGRISICTLDSFATSYLLSLEETSENLAQYDYNQRIQLFNRKIDAGSFEDFRYCIIDELQDLVNDRARMVINLLSVLKCGYLLLGDKCQAIYDYDCTSNDSINSTQFYEKLKEILPENTKKYEIVGNKRQTETLNKQSEALRNELLNYNFNTIINTFQCSLNSMTKSGWCAENFADSDNSKTTAILCRNNGEAEYTSWLLHKNKIPHSLIRSNAVAMSLHRCIADVLWDYANDRISEQDFRERLIIRSTLSEDDAAVIYSALSDLLYDEHRDYIACGLLAKILCTKIDYQECLSNSDNKNLTVSTIHKAKGKEFDKVYLLGYSYDSKVEKTNPNTEEERVLYVAQTRAKNEIEILPKRNKWNWYFKKSPENRWIKTKINTNNLHSFCNGIAVGYYSDIDYSSFVSGEIEEAIKKQYYISKHVKKGDKISLVLNGNNFDIMHNNTVIGRMSNSFINEITAKFNDGRQYIYNLPKNITDVYVENVFTYVSYKDFENIPPRFRKGRFWLAVEITGFGKVVWQENT